ncbi:MAG: MerR family transcriptional regulator [Alphaproteobacteria bacterium]|nr:MerR family transcriptional regulator [Alphaproteobacteria bacterium]
MNTGLQDHATSSVSVATPSSTSSVSSGDLKSPTAFRTISEVAEDLALPQHVLRFWESKFQQIKPLKRGGGRRYYRPEDIQVIHNIKDLLYNQGFTIRGVQKLLREGGKSPFARGAMDSHVPPASVVPLHAPGNSVAPAPGGLAPEKRREIEGVLNELKTLRELLRQSGI